MAPIPEAAAVQRSRTQSGAWRGSNQALVRGGAMQLQQAGANGSQMPSTSAFPAMEKPPWSLLSPQLSGNAEVDLQKTTSREFGALRARRPLSAERNSSSRPEALRDRVACTRFLSTALRNECLERLDQIAVPRNLRRRPSWTHLEDTLLNDSPPDSHAEASDACRSPAETSAGERVSAVVGHPLEESGDLQAFATLSFDGEELGFMPLRSTSKRESQVEREAALNFLCDFQADRFLPSDMQQDTFAPEKFVGMDRKKLLDLLASDDVADRQKLIDHVMNPQTQAPEPDPEVADASPDPSAQPVVSKARRCREAQLLEQPRYRKIWTVEDHDLSAAASVWKSSAKGTFSSRANRGAGRSLASNPRVGRAAAAMVETSLQESSLSRYDVSGTRFAIETARSAVQVAPLDEDGRCLSAVEGDAAPIARGMNSLLRTSLRHVQHA